MTFGFSAFGEESFGGSLESSDDEVPPTTSYLVVEDGTGKFDAESYISVADADSHHSERGNADWDALDDLVKEQKLRLATDYIEQVYGLSFNGRASTSTQALSFPRVGIFLRGYSLSSTSIPKNLVSACAELALKAIGGDLSPDVGQAVKSEKVDVLELVYQDHSSAIKKYRAIDNLLSPLLMNVPGGINRKVVRV